MSPLFISIKNPNVSSTLNDDTVILINGNGDVASISNNIRASISEQNKMREKKYLSKIIQLLGKNFTFLVATTGNITAQMIVSTTVAKTPWNKKQIIHSLQFSGLLIATDTLLEPYIFSTIENIENWVKEKWKNNENDINLNIGRELIKVIPVLLLLSYSAVLLDRASNDLWNIWDSWISMEIIGQTSIEFASYVLNMTLHGAIISRLEKIVKFSWRKLKSLFDKNGADIEDRLLNNYQNSIFFYKNIIPLFFITPISMAITWGTENYISNQKFTWKKIATDAPQVTGGITLSLISSLFNCMVNKEGIPFLPKMNIINSIKRWTGYQQNNDSIERSVISWQDSINDFNSIPVTNESQTIESVEVDIEEECNFEESQLSFVMDEENEAYFDAVENQPVDDQVATTNFKIFDDYCKTRICSNKGISSSTLKTEAGQSLFSKLSSFSI